MIQEQLHFIFSLVLYLFQDEGMDHIFEVQFV